MGPAFVAAMCLISALLSVQAAGGIGRSGWEPVTCVHLPATALAGFTGQPETLELALSDTPMPRDKETQDWHITLLRATGHLLVARLSQYILAADTRLSRYRKANGMFPFHSFW